MEIKEKGEKRQNAKETKLTWEPSRPMKEGWKISQDGPVLRWQKCCRAAVHAVCLVDESTRRRMSNAATPKSGRIEEEPAELDLAPTVMSGKAIWQEAALI